MSKMLKKNMTVLWVSFAYLFFPYFAFAQTSDAGGETEKKVHCSCVYNVTLANKVFFDCLKSKGVKECEDEFGGEFCSWDIFPKGKKNKKWDYLFASGEQFGFGGAQKVFDDLLTADWKTDHFEVDGDKGDICYLFPDTAYDSLSESIKSVILKLSYPDSGWQIDVNKAESSLCIPENIQTYKRFISPSPTHGPGFYFIEMTCEGRIIEEKSKKAGDQGAGGDGGTGKASYASTVQERTARFNKTGSDNFAKSIGVLIKAGLSVLGTIALIMFMYGGFVYMTSGGSAEDTKKAWNILVWGALGVIIILASYSLGVLIFNALV